MSSVRCTDEQIDYAVNVAEELYRKFLMQLPVELSHTAVPVDDAFEVVFNGFDDMTDEHVLSMWSERGMHL